MHAAAGDAATLSYLCWSLFLTLVSSIVVLPFYTYVPSSQQPPDKLLPSHLFFIKLLADMGARPITLYWRPFTTPRSLFVASAIRSSTACTACAALCRPK